MKDPAHFMPDDAGLTVPALEFLRTREGSSVRAAVASLKDAAAPSVGEIVRLRKQFPAEPLHAALVLAALQRKGRAKFPQLPYVWSPPEALEQASSSLVARHKAMHFANASPSRIFDLCCGIGGDTLALANIAPVAAIDLSPVRTACLRFNALDTSPPPRHAIDIRTADVRQIAPDIPSDALLHIDPARRSACKRSPRYEDLIPGPDFLEPLLKHVRGAAVKLSPAVDFESLPPGHLELVSQDGSVVQAILWTGTLADSPMVRTATVLSENQPTWSWKAAPETVDLPQLPLPAEGWLPAGESWWLVELDGALTRSAIAAPFLRTIDFAALTIDGGYALSRETPPLLPSITVFRLLALFPYSESRISQELSQAKNLARSNPCVEVKSRGHLPNIDTDHLQSAWSRRATGACTVLIFRHSRQIFAAIALRQAVQSPAMPTP